MCRHNNKKGYTHKRKKQYKDICKTFQPQFENLYVSPHALERFRKRTQNNISDDKIIYIIKKYLHYSRLIYIKGNEEKYVYRGLIFCLRRTKEQVIVKTILLTKTRQIDRFSTGVNHICREEFL